MLKYWICIVLLVFPKGDINSNKANSNLEEEYLRKTLIELQTKLDNLTTLIEYSKKDVRFAMHRNIIEALANYSGPIFIISSNYRTWSCKSQHYLGEAIDISSRMNFDEVVKYLLSSEGSAWLNKYRLDFYIENANKYRGHPKYKYNKKATGPHIHLFLKRRSNSTYI